SVNTSTQKGSIVQKLIKHDITVYASHTNLDIASGGVNDILAHKLNVLDVQPLAQTASENLFKLVAHVPKSHTRKVREALRTEGAGFIGDYRDRKSTRLNSSHVSISYAVFCLKKKK